MGPLPQIDCVLSREVHKIYEDQDIKDAIDIMKKNQLHRYRDPVSDAHHHAIP